MENDVYDPLKKQTQLHNQNDLIPSLSRRNLYDEQEEFWVVISEKGQREQELSKEDTTTQELEAPHLLTPIFPPTYACSHLILQAKDAPVWNVDDAFQVMQKDFEKRAVDGEKKQQHLPSSDKYLQACRI